MKFKISKFENSKYTYFFYLKSNNDFDCYSNLSIAKYLDMSYNQLFSIVNKYNIEMISGECYFNTYNDCKNCVEELEPYLVMKELTK